MNEKSKIEYLSVDTAFNILTRPALELVLSETPAFRVQSIYVLDLKDIHKLNIKLGYLKVNQKIKSILTRIKHKYPSIIMGRVFSGDEIALVYPQEEWTLIRDIIPFFEREGIGFKYISSEDVLGKSPQYYTKKFDKLINLLNKKNYFYAI